MNDVEVTQYLKDRVGKIRGAYTRTVESFLELEKYYNGELGKVSMTFSENLSTENLYTGERIFIMSILQKVRKLRAIGVFSDLPEGEDL